MVSVHKHTKSWSLEVILITDGEPSPLSRFQHALEPIHAPWPSPMLRLYKAMLITKVKAVLLRMSTKTSSRASRTWVSS